jgi:hypothetical protein
MSEFDLLKGVRDLDATLDDYRPKKLRRNRFESDNPPSFTYNDTATSICEEPTGCHVENNGLHAAPSSFNRRGHHNELGHSRVDEIAKAIRTLTYGEMLELAEAMWKVNSRGSEITESDLPGVLHRWSASQR